MNTPDKPSNQKPQPDPVEEASKESFPASDPPGWIGHAAEVAVTETVDPDPMGHLKQLASTEDPTLKAHYESICTQRDQVLTQAVVATAQTLLKESGVQTKPDTNPNPDRKQASNALQEHLSDSSISETDQRLLALLGTHGLFGMKVEMAQEDDVLRLFPSGGSELDPAIVLRLAKALDRSPQQEPVLWQKITEWVKPTDAPLVKAAIQMMLDEIVVGDEEKVNKDMVIDNTLGG